MQGNGAGLNDRRRRRGNRNGVTEQESNAGGAGIERKSYRLAQLLQPGEYAFFMGTGQQDMMASRNVSASSGGSAAGRIYHFSIPE
jgi:hypothetical protein